MMDTEYNNESIRRSPYTKCTKSGFNDNQTDL